MLIETHQVPAAQAYALLRERAAVSGCGLHQAATDVVQRRSG
jgi:hypothetical protein